jgi:hypothetical protein
VLAFSNVLDLLADELAGLGGRRRALPPIPRGALQCALLWHLALFLLS